MKSVSLTMKQSRLRLISESSKIKSLAQRTEGAAMNHVAFEKAKSLLAPQLSNDGHRVDELTSAHWKAISALIRDPNEEEKWFENSLDTDLGAALRCQSCGRAFLLLRLDEDAYFVGDEDGEEIESEIEPPCPAATGTIQVRVSKSRRARRRIPQGLSKGGSVAWCSWWRRALPQ
jgi:hypothetical protein